MAQILVNARPRLGHPPSLRLIVIAAGVLVIAGTLVVTGILARLEALVPA